MKENVKRIEDEEIENDVKVNEIENDVDTNTVSEEAENIEEMKLEIYGVTYKVSQLIEMMEKKKKTYLEKETVNRFRELMFNYYRGIKHAILKECCGKTYTINDLKAKLDYKTVDIRCSRKSIRFDKTTVDTIIAFVEKYDK